MKGELLKLGKCIMRPLQKQEASLGAAGINQQEASFLEYAMTFHSQFTSDSASEWKS